MSAIRQVFCDPFKCLFYLFGRRKGQVHLFHVVDLVFTGGMLLYENFVFR